MPVNVNPGERAGLLLLLSGMHRFLNQPDEEPHAVVVE